MEAQHNRVKYDDNHDKAIEPLPLGELNHRLPDLESFVEDVQTASVPAHLFIALNCKVMTLRPKPTLRIFRSPC